MNAIAINLSPVEREPHSCRNEEADGGATGRETDLVACGVKAVNEALPSIDF